MASAISCKQLAVTFRGRGRQPAVLALQPLDLELGTGRIVGVLGPNGSGKTTLLRVLAGLQRETGGNLGETLENLSDMLRKRRQVKLKVKALSSEAKASAYIIGSLPFLMFGVLYMLNEDYVMTLIRDPRGWYLIGAAATSLTLGVGIMMKMVKFEI